jgi:ParB-like chromosome segregation protein Spo0J
MTKPALNMKPAKGFRDFERDNDDVKKSEQLKVPLDRIKVRKGFNPRSLKKPKTIEKIEALTQAYVEKRFVPFPIVRMHLDGEHVEIIDGECRFTAACKADKILRDRGEDGITEYVVIKFTGTDEEAVALTYTSAEGESLTTLEQSNVVNTYRNEPFNMTRDQIAAELGKSVGWIDRLIVVAKLPDNIKALVADEKIAAEEAVKYVKQHGDDAFAKITEKLAAAEANGESKVTPKHDKGDEGGEGEGGEGGDGTVDSSKADKAAAKAEQKRVLKQLETAKDLAFALPDKIKKPRNMQDEDVYPVELSGAAIKLLIALQDKFTPEIEAALAEQE